MLIIMIVSILVFSLSAGPIRLSAWRCAFCFCLSLSRWLRLIKFAGRHDNWFTRILSAPGHLQRLTTDEPDDSMIEVAVEALQMGPSQKKKGLQTAISSSARENNKQDGDNRENI
ncbi:MAG: DUF1385 domain-containing protein [Odoribacter sp.]